MRPEGVTDSHNPVWTLCADRQRVLLRALLDAGSRGFFVCGGTGEGKAMSVPERMNVAEVVADEVAGEVPIILQVGACPTPDAAELAQHAAHIQGIGAVASVAPIDSPNDLDAAVAHYRAIGAATQLPFYVYWLQGEADITATANRFLDAMGTVPHFAGIKFTDHNLYLFGQLIDRSGMAWCISAFGREEMAQIAIEEWAGASDRFIPQCIVPIGPAEATVAEIRGRMRNLQEGAP